MKIRYSLLFLLTFAFLTASDTFQQGIDAYHDSEYSKASSAFEAELETNETAAAHHNLALALFQEGKPGSSVWHLERALLLEPWNEQYHYKLGALRQQLGLMASRPKWHALASKALSQQSWIILLSIAFWLTLAAFVLPKASGLRIKLQIKAARIVGLIVIILSSTALYLNLHLASQGIVLSESPVTLHAAPASAAPQTGLARPGERGQQVDQHGDYIEIKTEGGARGWLNVDNFKALL